MKISLSLFFGIFLIILNEQAPAQTNAPAAAAPPPPPLPAGTVKVLDQSYEKASFHGMDRDSTQTLDLFVPPGPGPFPLVVWIHGGGWHAGGKEADRSLCLPYLAHGIALAGVDYRWIQDAGFPAQMEDCNDAIGWLRAHAGLYHLDPNEVGVMGHSAGGHLSALIAATGDGTTFKNPQKVQAAVCFAGVYDLDRDRGQWPHTMFMWSPRDALYRFPFFPNRLYDTAFAQYASPQSYIHAGMPPMLIFHGDADATVPLGQAQVFAADLKKAGVDVTFHIGAGKTHGGIFGEAEKAEAFTFLQRHLLPKP